MKSSVRFFVLMLIVLTAVLTAAIAAGAQRNAFEGSFDRVLNASGSVDLDVSTGSGSITVRQGAAERVEVKGRIRVGTDRFRSDRDAEDVVRSIEANPPIEQTGNTIRIGRFDDRDSGRNVSISYEIVVPANTPVRAGSGSGRVDVSSINAAVSASTGSGAITLNGIGGPVRASTGSGGVTLSQTAPGDVEITTGSGTVRAGGVRGALRVQTGSGGITAEGEQTGRWDLQTSSGSINVRLPQTAGFDLNAHTSSGNVYVDHPLTVQGTIDGRRRNVSGRVRGGGYALDVRTSSGNIRID